MTTGRDTRFKPGNPGRPKGSKNKLQEDVIRDVCTVWEEGGIAALRTLATEDPGKFVDAAIKLLPKDVNHTVQRSAAELTDEELARIIVEAGSRIGTDEAEGHTGSLTEWCRHAGFEPARHHQLLIEALEDVAAGRCDRLMVFMPPGSAKSTYSSQLFVPWYMAQHPGHMVIAASHTQELADHWGRRVRNLIGLHGLTLGISIAKGNSAADRWALDSGGEYFAAGVGGAIAGRRADLVLIDDPVKSREDADSEVMREKTMSWYRSDLVTRLKPGARIVIIQTRWHEDDLSGRILEQMKAGGDQFRVISLPALAGLNDPLGRNPGEALWPEWEDKAQLERKRTILLPREWSALFQQNPVPEDGDYFKSDWIRTTPQLPPRDTLRVFGGSDYAVTSEGGDYTVHVVVGIDAQQRLYLLDLWRGQTSSDVWIEAFCDLVKAMAPMSWGEEQGQIRSGVGPFLTRRMMERQAITVRMPFLSKTDKAVRAQSIRGRMAMNGLYIAADAPFRADFVSELLSFPAGKHDDQVDALGLVGQLLDHAAGYEKKPDPDTVPGPRDGRFVALGIKELNDRYKRRTDPYA